jgi:hypothetical protein
MVQMKEGVMDEETPPGWSKDIVSIIQAIM